MGLNMPAKTVIFTQVKKFDGTESRWITSGEYIQMSGRAGRRGKDDKGLVIMMVDETLDIETCRCAPGWCDQGGISIWSEGPWALSPAPSALVEPRNLHVSFRRARVRRQMVSGKPSPLNSSFKLSYYTLLNLLRRLETSGHDMEYVIARSFQQFQHERRIPEVGMCALLPQRCCTGLSVSVLRDAAGLPGQAESARHGCWSPRALLSSTAGTGLGLHQCTVREIPTLRSTCSEGKRSARPAAPARALGCPRLPLPACSPFMSGP